LDSSLARLNTTLSFTKLESVEGMDLVKLNDQTIDEQLIVLVSPFAILGGFFKGIFKAVVVKVEEPPLR